MTILSISAIICDFLASNLTLLRITFVSAPTYKATHITYAQFRIWQPRKTTVSSVMGTVSFSIYIDPLT